MLSGYAEARTCNGQGNLLKDREIVKSCYLEAIEHEMAAEIFFSEIGKLCNPARRLEYEPSSETSVVQVQCYHL